MKNMNKHVRQIATVLFIVYMVALILVLVLKLPTSLGINSIKAAMENHKIVRMEPQPVPFKTTLFYINRMEIINDWFGKNLICNIVAFIPFGMLLPILLKKKRIIKTIMAGILLSAIIETLQYATGLGQMDIDDVILNGLSTVIGVGCFSLLAHICPKLFQPY